MTNCHTALHLANPSNDADALGGIINRIVLFLYEIPLPNQGIVLVELESQVLR